MLKNRKYLATATVVAALSFINVPAQAGDGEAMVKGLMGMVINQMAEEAGKNDPAPAQQDTVVEGARETAKDEIKRVDISSTSSIEQASEEDGAGAGSQENLSPSVAQAIRARKILLAEIQRLNGSGKHVHEYMPTTALAKAIKGKNSLVVGDYYLQETQTIWGNMTLELMEDETRFLGKSSYTGNKIIGRRLGSNYEASQVLDDYVLYQNQKTDMPPILLEREKGRLYIENQGLDVAGSLFEYVGDTSYRSITGASVQAFVFRAVKNKKIEEAYRLLDEAMEM